MCELEPNDRHAGGNTKNPAMPAHTQKGIGGSCCLSRLRAAAPLPSSWKRQGKQQGPLARWRPEELKKPLTRRTDNSGPGGVHHARPDKDGCRVRQTALQNLLPAAC